MAQLPGHEHGQRPMTEQALDLARRSRLLRVATYLSLTVALLLVIAKTWAWLATGSVSMLSSLADSLLDVLASGLTFWAIRYSLSPADPEHRFGHGKSEGLAALLQGLVVAGSASFVCWEAVQRLIHPRLIERPETGLLVIGGATVATFLLVLYQRYVSRITGSLAIAADTMHYSADLLVNVSVAAAVTVSAWTGWKMMDPLVGLGVGAFILSGAFRMASRALDILLDREIPEEDRRKLQQIALEHPDVLGIHDMRTRHGGLNYILQFHLDLPHDMSLLRSHEVLDEVEQQVRSCYPGCEIIIHPDPLGVSEPRDGFDAARAQPPQSLESKPTE